MKIKTGRENKKKKKYIKFYLREREKEKLSILKQHKEKDFFISLFLIEKSLKFECAREREREKTETDKILLSE